MKKTDRITSYNVCYTKLLRTNHDYEPYARKRDKAVFQLLQQHSISFKTCKDQVIFEKDEITKSDGSPYVVYTPYSKKWKEEWNKKSIVHYPSEKLLDKIAVHSYPFLSLADIGFKTSEIKVPNFNISDNLIANYEETRNFPAIKGTSFLSTHLRFGTISIRKIAQKADQFSNKTFLNELIWREFFMQILWYFPHTINLV